MKRGLAFLATFALGFVLGSCLNGKTRPASNCKAVGAACSKESDCCSFGCASTCQCNPLDGGVCATSADCCAGLHCADNSCVPGCHPAGDSCATSGECCNGECDAGHCGSTVCAGAGAACSASSPCCLGASCDAGLCRSCTADFAACNTGAECCNGNCMGGACACLDPGTACTRSADCCSGRCLANGMCDCSGPNEGCNNPQSCCSPSMCNGAADGGPQTACCTRKNAPCDAGSDCCSGNCNGNGVCR